MSAGGTSDPLDYEDAIAIAGKVVEMCSRVREAQKFAPGAVAKWTLGIDDRTYTVSVEVTQ